MIQYLRKSRQDDSISAHKQTGWFNICARADRQDDSISAYEQTRWFNICACAEPGYPSSAHEQTRLFNICAWADRLFWICACETHDTIGLYTSATKYHVLSVPRQLHDLWYRLHISWLYCTTREKDTSTYTIAVLQMGNKKACRTRGKFTSGEYCSISITHCTFIKESGISILRGRIVIVQTGKLHFHSACRAMSS